MKEYKIITREEVIKEYSKYYDEYEMMVMFAYHTDHPIENSEGRYRWLQTIEYSEKLGNDPNQMGRKVHDGEITQKEHMEYNRQIGYSLYGYWEIYVSNGRFDEEQYDIDMIQEREEKLNKLI